MLACLRPGSRGLSAAKGPNDRGEAGFRVRAGPRTSAPLWPNPIRSVWAVSPAHFIFAPLAWALSMTRQKSAAPAVDRGGRASIFARHRNHVGTMAGAACGNGDAGAPTVSSRTFAI